MSGRVLNFFEFSDKYSTGNSDPLGVDNISNAAANFEEGFDDTTYDQPDLGPKRPVSGSYEATPAGPGGTASAFTPGARPGMEAPEEEEEEDDEDDDDDSGNPEGEEEEEKVEESFRLVKSFKRFVNESYEDYSGEDYSDNYGYDGEKYSDDYGYDGGDYSSDYYSGDEYGANPEGEDIVAQVEDAASQLTDEERAIIADYLSNDPEGFQEMVEDELEQSTDAGANPRGSMGMGKEEFETRKIIDKIIKGVAIGSTLAIVPAAMFISGGLALALGITGVVSGIAKDAAWMKRGSHHYRAQDLADSGMDYPEDDEYGIYPEGDDYYDEEESFCPSCGAVEDEYGYSCGCNM